MSTPSKAPKSPRSRQLGLGLSRRSSALPGGGAPATGRSAAAAIRPLCALALLGALALAGVLLSAARPAAAAEDGCDNAQIRSEQGSTHLPDCRAYEQVSPTDKNFSDAFPGTTAFASFRVYNTGTGLASLDGDRFAFKGPAVVGDTQQASVLVPYAARRTDEVWQVQPLRPDPGCLNDPDKSVIPAQSGNRGFVTSLITRAAINQPESAHCAIPPIDPAAPTPSNNLYRLDLDPEPASYRLLTPVDGNFSIQNTAAPSGEYLAGSDDLSHVVYGSGGAQTPDTPLQPTMTGPTQNLYDWHDGTLELVSRDTSNVPFANGPAYGSAIGGFWTADARNAVSASGDRIYFQNAANVPSGPGSAIACNAGCQLYLRQSNAVTYQVSKSECTSSCTSSSQDLFQWASTSGDRAYFTSTDNLTDDPTPSGSKLYLYRNSDDPASDPDNLTLVSTDSEAADGNSAAVLGTLGASDDGNTVYFAANGQLVAGEPTASGPKLYRWRWNGGSPQLDYLGTIATGATDAENWDGTERRVTPSGETLVVETNAQLLPAADQDSDTDLYRWREADGWDCVSCQPVGDPSGGPSTTPRVGTSGTNATFSVAITRELGSAVSDDGETIFFNTQDPLDPDDSNGPCSFDSTLKYYPCNDVYEWHDGELSLITPGDGDYDNGLIGTSDSGDDVFFFTRQKLAGWDTDNLIDIYDARVGGGFAEPTEKVDCDGDECQKPGTDGPGADDPGSSTFEGPGNPSGRAECDRLLGKALNTLESAQHASKRAQHASKKRAKKLRKRAKKLRKRAKKLKKQYRECKRGDS